MLPSDWTDHLFARLSVRYGAQWLRLWEGLDIKDVKADWSRTLSGFTGTDIAHALEHLPPDRPPTAGQFRELCRRAPGPTLARLEAPKTLPAGPVADALRGFRPGGGSVNPRAWAERLQQREAAGERLSMAQREAWRQAARPGGSDAVLEDTLRGVA